MPFDERDDSETNIPVRKIGLKKNNTVAAKNNNLEMKENFEQIADSQHNKIENYKQQTWDLSLKYKSFIENKVLAENRGPIHNSLEKEVLDKLVSLATEMNKDVTQEEGIGNTALCMLLMKCMLIQRDIINSLNFKLEKLEKDFLATKK